MKSLDLYVRPADGNSLPDRQAGARNSAKSPKYIMDGQE